MVRRAQTLSRVSFLVIVGCLVLAGASSGATLAGRVVFSVNGNAVEFSGGIDTVAVDASVALPDGDVVLVGGSNVADSTFFAAELEPDGSLDPSFGVDGVEHVKVPVSAVEVLLEPDGKLLVLATAPALSKFQLPQLMVVRLDANGTLDQTYGVDGVARTGLEGFAAGAAISTDGELLLSGTTGSESSKPPPTPPPNFHWVVEELTSAGTLDPAFGRNGTTTIAVKQATGGQLAVESDGDIVAEGSNQTTTTYLTRLTPQGAADPTFAAGRPVATALGGGAMLVQPDGSITLLDDGGLERYTSDGTLDPAFGSHGQTPLPALVAVVNQNEQLLPGPGTDVLVASYPSNWDSSDDIGSGPLAIEVAAIKSNGAPDKSISATRELWFGGGASSYYGPPFAATIPPDENSLTFGSPPLLQRADGSYLVVGTVGIFEPAGAYGTFDNYYEGNYFYEFAAAAFTPTFAPDTSFGTPPTPPIVTLALPLQRTTTDLGVDSIHLALHASFQGLIDVTIRDRHGVIAQTAYPVYRPGAHSFSIRLTGLGKRDLGASRTIPVTITAYARDLLATTATTTTHATLG